MNHQEQKSGLYLKNLILPLTTKKALYIIIIFGIVVFAKALFIQFVWDDHSYILENPDLRNFNLLSFFGNNLFNNANQYRPLVVVYFALLFNIFTTNPFFYHFLQIAIHIINASLLFFLFKTFFNKKLALFLSLIFLIHPMQVESVSYISSSGSVLLFFFGIFALLLASKNTESTRSKIYLYASLLASFLVKETGLLFLPLIIFYQFIFKKKYKMTEIVFSSVILVIYFFLRFSVGNVSLADRQMIPIARLSFLDRLITIPAVIFYYIKTFFYPVTLIINQQWVVNSVSVTNFYIPLIADIIFFGLLVWFGIYLYKKKTEQFAIYLFFLLWFCLGMFLHSQIVALDATVADRWFYFDIAGLLGILGVILQCVKFPNTKIAVYVSIVIISLLSLRTIIRNNEWINPVNLWRHDIAYEDNYLSQEELALAYTYEGRLDEALPPAKKSVEVFPTDLNLYNLGYIYEAKGDKEKAKDIYYQAYHAKNYLPWQHRHYLALYLRLSNLLLFHNDTATAKNILKDALSDYPDSGQLWMRLAICEYEIGNRQEAVKAAEHAVSLQPNDRIIYTVYYNIINNRKLDLKI